ncbi:hypothetical protein [Escherichia coli]
MRTYTISTSFRLCAVCDAKRKRQKGITAEMAIYHLSMKIISRKTATVPLLLLPTVPALSYPMTVPD